MLENVLIRNNIRLGVKISIKTFISIILITLAVGLPQFVHLVAGPTGGMTWMPMYLPVLLAGLLLGVWWGIGVGILSPIVSFLITSIFKNPMPALTRLPFMIVELVVFAAISGLFSKKIIKNELIVFPAVLIAQIIGRLTFLLVVAMFQNISALSVSMALNQIKMGLIGVLLQVIIVPFIIICLNRFINKEKNND